METPDKGIFLPLLTLYTIPLINVFFPKFKLLLVYEAL
jgi:hypothetical protein